MLQPPIKQRVEFANAPLGASAVGHANHEEKRKCVNLSHDAADDGGDRCPVYACVG